MFTVHVWEHTSARWLEAGTGQDGATAPAPMARAVTRMGQLARLRYPQGVMQWDGLRGSTVSADLGSNRVAEPRKETSGRDPGPSWEDRLDGEEAATQYSRTLLHVGMPRQAAAPISQEFLRWFSAARGWGLATAERVGQPTPPPALADGPELSKGGVTGTQRARGRRRTVDARVQRREGDEVERA